MANHMTRSEKRAQTQARNDAKAVLDSPAAVRFVCGVLEDCGFYGDPYSSANNETMRRLGMRTTGLQIMARLTAADPNAHSKLLQAAANERAKHAQTEVETNDA